VWIKHGDQRRHLIADDIQQHNNQLVEVKQLIEAENKAKKTTQTTASLVGHIHPYPLPIDTQDVPYFRVGDDDIILRTFLIKP